jgi:regulator of sirC expression with transglutaminase-like and TPR domain
LALFLQAIRQNPWRTWEDLERFSRDLCEFEHGQFDRAGYLDYLDKLAGKVRDKASGADDTRQKVIALRQVLADEEGFRGDVDDYYNPANSHLDSSITFRKGLPLTLTLVYVFVGRRLGWEVEGIGVPSHYLGALDKVLFDPFHGGVILDEVRPCRAAINSAASAGPQST